MINGHGSCLIYRSKCIFNYLLHYILAPDNQKPGDSSVIGLFVVGFDYNSTKIHKKQVISKASSTVESKIAANTGLTVQYVTILDSKVGSMKALQLIRSKCIHYCIDFDRHLFRECFHFFFNFNIDSTAVKSPFGHIIRKGKYILPSAADSE